MTALQREFPDFLKTRRRCWPTNVSKTLHLQNSGIRGHH